MTIAVVLPTRPAVAAEFWVRRPYRAAPPGRTPPPRLPARTPSRLELTLVDNLYMLAIIMGIVVLSSFVASLIPGRPVPEVVFFVFAGAIAGPHCLGLIQPLSGLSLVARLGMGMLFLIAGYELDPRELVGRMGRHGAVCWLVSAAIAFAVVPLLGLDLSFAGTAAFAIALTTTAYGTLVPIMRDRCLNGTSVGKVVDSYGAMGELLPVVAMSLLLSPSRSLGMNVAVLVGFVVVCVLVATQADLAKRAGTRLSGFLRENAEGRSQATLRATIFLLLTLLALAAVLDLDAVLAAFAAGFILRRVAPSDQGKKLMEKVEVLGNGFLIPAFFVFSGISIDFKSVGAAPGLLAAFSALLLLVRAVPLGVCLHIFPETRDMPIGEKISASLYCTMALPLIVALTEAALTAGAMSAQMASVLVTGGALTVLVIPVITSISRAALAAHPVEAAGEIAEHPEELRRIVHEHREHAHEAFVRFHEERERELEGGHRLSSADYLARRDELRHRRRREE